MFKTLLSFILNPFIVYLSLAGTSIMLIMILTFPTPSPYPPLPLGPERYDSTEPTITYLASSSGKPIRLCKSIGRSYDTEDGPQITCVDPKTNRPVKVRFSSSFSVPFITSDTPLEDLN